MIKTKLINVYGHLVCGITNVFAIVIVVDSESETVQYQYYGGREPADEPIKAEIKYDDVVEEGEEIEPYFETVAGMKYYLKEFIRR